MQPYTVQKGDTLNAISQKYGYANYKDAGLTAKSGNPDMIFPGETFNISQNPAKNAYINNAASSNASQIADVTSRLNTAKTDLANKLNEPPSQQSVADTSYSNYLNSLQQPQDTTEATNYLNSLTTQSKLDQEKALNTGESMAFATGEAQRVARNNAIYTDAAASKLQTLISRDASKTTIAKARAEYEQAKLKATQDAQPKPFELSPGQKRYEYDSKTGAYKEIASVAPTPKAPEKQTEAEKKAPMVADVNNAVNQLRTIVKTKAFKGVSPDDYLTMKDYMLSTYGYEGVSELDKAMATLGLVVDNTKTK